MHTRNEVRIAAPLDACFRAAAEVERWPELLPHYREVRMTREGPVPRVLMRAVRTFGPVPWPIWWESDMRVDPERVTVRYRHVRGMTTGMDVEWRLEEEDGGTRVVIVHDWAGPGWPLLGGFVARRVIGPHFVHVVAGRTLDGIRRAVEGDAAGGAGATAPARSRFIEAPATGRDAP